MISWKTWLSGGVAAIGMLLPVVTKWLGEQGSSPDWKQLLGAVIAALGVMGLGQFARDDNVSSDGKLAKKDAPPQPLYDAMTGAKLPVTPSAPPPAS